MNIFFTEDDLSQMPPALRTSLLRWQMSRTSGTSQASARRHSGKPTESVHQLSLLPIPENQRPKQKRKDTRVTLTHLYDAGITKQGMPIRVRLKRDLARDIGRDYINSLAISQKGKVVFQGQEFNIPSQLATEVNGSSANGWDYVEVKTNGHWVQLDLLRQTLRQTSAS